MPVDANVVKGTIRPIRNNILIEEMHFGFRTTKAGLILLDDDAKERGIRPRWGKVYSVGHEQHDVVKGDWILVAHGRWTRKITYDINGELKEIRMVDPKDVLGVQKEEPEDEYVADSITNIA